MAVKSYKCPNCGAGIEFKPALQKFSCEYCLSEYTVEEFTEKNKDIEEKEKEGLIILIYYRIRAVITDLICGIRIDI